MKPALISQLYIYRKVIFRALLIVDKFDRLLTSSLLASGQAAGKQIPILGQFVTVFCYMCVVYTHRSTNHHPKPSSGEGSTWALHLRHALCLSSCDTGIIYAFWSSWKISSFSSASLVYNISNAWIHWIFCDWEEFPSILVRHDQVFQLENYIVLQLSDMLLPQGYFYRCTIIGFD